MADEKQAKTVEVTLLDEHEHKGVLHVKGSKITVTEDQAKWLKALGKV